jgi:hypothetical protein
VRAFAARSGAERVVLLLEAAAGEGTTMVDCTAGGEVELTAAGRTWTVPAGAAVRARPRELPDIRSVPASALTVDPDAAQLAAPLGAVGHLADAVLALARAFGGRTVATAEFATADPELPITLAAREGEPPVVSAGGREFLLP